ncbi:RICIN domain-containing protein [Streptomyces sp. URMC 123]|uniref:RICIN domain-containing protein n=1 Tax=Streptomyces sp. URMC 123 TaxID=3423403 RepID=UPI003F1BBE9E
MSGIVEGGAYRFRNLKTGLYLTGHEGSIKDVGPVTQEALMSGEDGARQVWIATSREARGVTVGLLRNEHSGLYLHIAAHDTSPSAHAEQFRFIEDHAASYGWRFKAEGDGAGTLVNVHSGLPLNVQGHKHEAGTRIEQWNDPAESHGYRLWVAEHAGLPEGTYLLRNDASGLYATVRGGSKDSGTQIEQQPLRTASWRGSQLWEIRRGRDDAKLKDTVPEDSGLYVLRNQASGLYLHISNHSAHPSKLADQSDPDTADQWDKSSFLWQIRSLGGGRYGLVNAKNILHGSGDKDEALWLHVQARSTEPGGLLEQTKVTTGGDFLNWRFEPAPAPAPTATCTLNVSGVWFDDVNDDYIDQTLEVYGSVQVTHQGTTTVLVDTDDDHTVKVPLYNSGETSGYKMNAVGGYSKTHATTRGLYGGEDPWSSEGPRRFKIGTVTGEVDDPQNSDQAFSITVNLKDWDPTVLDPDEDIAQGTVIVMPDSPPGSYAAELQGPGHPTLDYNFHRSDGIPPATREWQMKGIERHFVDIPDAPEGYVLQLFHPKYQAHRQATIEGSNLCEQLRAAQNGGEHPIVTLDREGNVVSIRSPRQPA